MTTGNHFETMIGQAEKSDGEGHDTPSTPDSSHAFGMTHFEHIIPMVAEPSRGIWGGVQSPRPPVRPCFCRKCELISWPVLVPSWSNWRFAGWALVCRHCGRILSLGVQEGVSPLKEEVTHDPD